MTDETPDQRWTRLSQTRNKRVLPKRFYKLVSAGPDHSILLDGRSVKTPLKAKLLLPSALLAEAVAGEWQAQVAVINPALMPLTKLANTAIDRLGLERAQMAAEVLAFAGNDLVCYRAENPADLVALQAAAWDPVLAWAAREMDAKFNAVQGVVHVAQNSVALQAVARRVGAFDNHTLTAVHNLMTLTGSALLALMVQARGLAADEAWAAAHVDEDYQISQWGEDVEAAARRAFRKSEFDATAQFLRLIDDSLSAT